MADCNIVQYSIPHVSGYIAIPDSEIELHAMQSQDAQQLIPGNPSLGVARSILSSGQMAISSYHVLRLRDGCFIGQLFEADQEIAAGERPTQSVRRNGSD